jgi:hypothetical protein
MNQSDKIDKNSMDFQELSQLVNESDFDGHTAFQTMTFTQKLAWLSEAVVSMYILAKNNPTAGCNLFFNQNDPKADKR